ncbi:hypothetical protein HK098_000511 [Nowakowskiella sp. JEL0407]|nr:hypothetical protein HK098_000511 [Nowakowskiella sp. JEL0407]
MQKEEDNVISLSVEETNKLREKLGLPPLKLDSGSSADKRAEENYLAHVDENLKKAQEKELRNKIEKARNKRELAKKLSGKSIAEQFDDEDDNPLAWIQRSRNLSKKNQSQTVKKTTNEVKEYTSADLRGLRVGHDAEDIQDTGETILVLKDSTIEQLEAEGDEMMSVSLVDHEKTRQNLENKRKRPGYVAYDDEELMLGSKRKILSQYDEELEGPKKHGFSLDDSGAAAVEDLAAKNAKIAESLREQGKKLESLEFNKVQQITDYYTKDEVVEFKPKKKKKKVKGRVKDDEDSFDAPAVDRNGDTEMADTSSATASASIKPFAFSSANKNLDDINFVDDDDLQAALAKQRRLATKQKVLKSVDDIIKESEIEEKNQMETDQPSGGMEFSATTEFIRTLSAVPVFQPTRPKVAESTSANTTSTTQTKMDIDVSDKEDEVLAMKREKELLRARGGWASQPQEDGELDDDDDDDEEVTGGGVLEDEPLVANSMAAAVKLLSQKGLITKASQQDIERERRQKEKELWIIEQKKREVEKELNKKRQRELERQRNGGKKAQGGANDRDWERDREKERERYREEEEERRKILETEKRFQDYAPDIKLEYHDEFGRQLTPKEAYRQLSHRFHGKGSGKLKTEKRLKKIQEEEKMKKVAAFDVPISTGNAKNSSSSASGKGGKKSAHVVLAVGSKGSVPKI